MLRNKNFQGMAFRSNMLGVVVAAAAAALMLSGGGAGILVHARDWCPTKEFVYPYWSSCFQPATRATPYHIVSAPFQYGRQGLDPEWDEDNSTYYVRFTGNPSALGATYEVPQFTFDAPRPILLSSNVTLYNTESGRSLGWRDEGGDEWFLIEVSTSGSEAAAIFHFERAEGVFLPCPRSLTARCEAYYLLSDPTNSGSSPTTGWLPYEEDGATYIKAAPLGSKGNLPILFIVPSTTDLHTDA